ncbi:cation transporter [Micromonospora sp. DH15]|nr:cation transporter [Micromonospora sp. DH15]
MGAGHDHHHGAANAADRHSGRLWAAFALLAALMIVEAVTALGTGSLALLSDAGHMFTDVLGIGMALAAITATRRATADPQRTFGLYRLEVLAALDTIAANEDRALRELLTTRDEATKTRQALDGEIREQRKQVALMGKRKEQAERALTVANNKASSSGGGSSPGGTSSANATPAKRNSDGSWPAESCSVNDPTPANGCITPRTLHALNQAKAAGFTRYVSCYRPGGSGEHPKGRACDFAAQKGGFGGVASGGDRTYGNNLAAYFVRNADRLAVLYVIWFKQIWLPSSGWKAYSGGNGDPSSDHTNHVHLSVI